MLMELEDVISLLTELRENKVTLALTPNENTNIQYVNIGIAEGIKIVIKKLENLERREGY